MKTKLFIAIAALCLVACTSTQKEVETKKNEAMKETSIKEIPYQVAQNYFVRNDIQLPVPAKINSQEEFDNFFGRAAVMGKNGEPTRIDFAKQFVIAVVLPETNTDVSFDNKKLTSVDEALLFEYHINRGNEVNSWTQIPMLLIIVDRQYEYKNVITKEIL